MRKRLLADHQLRRWVKHSLEISAGAFPNSKYEMWTQCQVFVPHAVECIGHLADDKEDILNQALLAFRVGVYILDRGEYNKAQTLLLTSKTRREDVLGPEHPDTLSSIFHIGLVLLGQWKNKEAEVIIQQAANRCEEALGLKHRDTLDVISCLGVALER
ncbi:hypothetical protein QQS21_006693 [Conoideocrella luteorostrata]|uniref:Kinesin light chain n=1 Tax=Conoideocrella luteorostrata TaxID=1105319 RepID=A0AAJ0CQ22_9HYPO|nr:hypothetical protein QQS21_006693 [Conoideocrella luteorostrata]